MNRRLNLVFAAVMAGPVGLRASDPPWRSGWMRSVPEPAVLGVTAKHPATDDGETKDDRPFDRWSLDFETGSLWRVSNQTFLNYTILPQVISLRTPAHIVFDLGNGAAITLRSRFSLLVEPVVAGPETVYLGISGSPSIEYWTPDRRWAFYFSAGGGVGTIDSRGVPGGQGQDRTLNWFIAGGLRYYCRPALALSLGVMFQHWSNGGATDPNPGLDQFGPTLGLAWTF